MNILKCIIGILIPFLGTTFGAAVVFAFRKPISDKMQKVFLGFASGVMLAASIWSLIIPAIEHAEEQGNPGWFAATIGIIFGALFLIATDIYMSKMKKFKSKNNKTSFKTSMLSLAITLHNIPEGMAVGIVFASALSGNFATQFTAAMIFAIGIAIQNFPEGMAISLPCKSDRISNGKSFLYGMLSGIVEPIAAIITLLISSIITSALPYLLAFAAGSMLFVTFDELIPSMHETKDGATIATIGVIVGFIIMMVLDVVL